MIFWVWLFTFNPAQAIDLNDHVRLTLDGGEVVEGYYLRPGANEVVLTRPGVNGTSRIPLAIVDSVELNGDQTPFDVFSKSIKSEWSDWILWASDPPPHPPPFAVAVASGVVAGTGHSWLGDSQQGLSMALVDVGCMTMAGLEIAGRGTGRVDVLMGSIALSALFKAYAASESVRMTKRVRRRIREVREESVQ